MSIALKEFLGNVQAIVDAKPSYQLGEDGSHGKCDCIGLVMGAFRRSGGKWPGIHGSNWAARNFMATMESPAPLELGTIVFKAREPDAAANQLPATYKNHPDKRDYYHVGVVTSVSPLRITHCTGGTANGIKVDAKIGVWRFGGRLKEIDYDQQNEETSAVMDEMEVQAIVTADKGVSVRMRAKPNGKALVLANVPIGDKVEVQSIDSDWWEVKYNGAKGWMMAQYLRIEEPEFDAEIENEPTLEEKVDILWAAYKEHSA